MYQPLSFIIPISSTRQETAGTHADVLVPAPVAGHAAVGTAGAGWPRCLRPAVEDTVGADGAGEAVAGDGCSSAGLTCVTSDRHGWFVYKKIKVDQQKYSLVLKCRNKKITAVDFLKDAKLCFLVHRNEHSCASLFQATHWASTTSSRQSLVLTNAQRAARLREK